MRNLNRGDGLLCKLIAIHKKKHALCTDPPA
jgi:hypothetical protein